MIRIYNCVSTSQGAIMHAVFDLRYTKSNVLILMAILVIFNVKRIEGWFSASVEHNLIVLFFFVLRELTLEP